MATKVEKDRKQLGISLGLYTRIKEAAERHDVKMTQLLDALVERVDDCGINWKEIRETNRIIKPSWQNMMKRVDEIIEKFGPQTDERLCEFTGYSLASVEALTHTSHKRVIKVLKRRKDIDPATLAEKASVSLRFAERMLDMYHGRKKPPERERYLFATGSKR